jgi:hypothetical protein
MRSTLSIASLCLALTHLIALPVLANDRTYDILMIFATAECAVAEKLFSFEEANEWIGQMVVNANILDSDVAAVKANPRVGWAVHQLIGSAGGCKDIMSRL